MFEICGPPFVVAAAVLWLAQNQGWAASGISQRGPSNPVIPDNRVDAFFCDNNRPKFVQLVRLLQLTNPRVLLVRW